ncbi:MAG TPA: hypothetical protein VGI59_07955 [Candidatus Udaeobacter sp.]|jgi:hypothetical protein
MFVGDLVTALAIATVFTIAFCGILGDRKFRWNEASLSTLLLIFLSWVAAAGLVALVPLLSRSRASAIELMTSIAACAGLALMASRSIRRALRVIIEPAQTAARFSVLLYFSIILSLLFSAVFTRYALARLL